MGKLSMEELERLAFEGMTHSEIGNLHGLGSEFFLSGEAQGAYKRGYARMQRGLREKQLELARGGHPSMLMWLGKQHLGQRDQVGAEIKGKFSHLAFDVGLVRKLSEVKLRIARGEESEMPYGERVLLDGMRKRGEVSKGEIEEGGKWVKAGGMKKGQRVKEEVGVRGKYYRKAVAREMEAAKEEKNEAKA